MRISTRARPECYCHRQMLGAIRCLVDNGVKWRNLPADFPPWKRVYAFFRRWRDNRLIRELHDRLRDPVRKTEGRNTEPTAAVVDLQSVKADATVRNDSRGFDGGKKINGRKRHLIVDCLGLLLTVLVTPASTTDQEADATILPVLREGFRKLRLVWADSGDAPIRMSALTITADPGGLGRSLPRDGRSDPRPRSAGRGVATAGRVTPRPARVPRPPGRGRPGGRRRQGRRHRPGRARAPRRGRLRPRRARRRRSGACPSP